MHLNPQVSLKLSELAICQTCFGSVPQHLAYCCHFSLIIMSVSFAKHPVGVSTSVDCCASAPRCRSGAVLLSDIQLLCLACCCTWCCMAFVVCLDGQLVWFFWQSELRCCGPSQSYLLCCVVLMSIASLHCIKGCTLYLYKSQISREEIKYKFENNLVLVQEDLFRSFYKIKETSFCSIQCTRVS